MTFDQTLFSKFTQSNIEHELKILGFKSLPGTNIIFLLSTVNSSQIHPTFQNTVSGSAKPRDPGSSFNSRTVLQN